MKRKQIIEILKSPHYFINGKVYLSDFYRIADEILALPIDVPSEEEIKNRYGKSPSNHIHGDRFAEESAKWAISEIIKRNQK